MMKKQFKILTSVDDIRVYANEADIDFDTDAEYLAGKAAASIARRLGKSAWRVTRAGIDDANVHYTAKLGQRVGRGMASPREIQIWVPRAELARLREWAGAGHDAA